jgi:hypothetical protein
MMENEISLGTYVLDFSLKSLCYKFASYSLWELIVWLGLEQQARHCQVLGVVELLERQLTETCLE